MALTEFCLVQTTIDDFLRAEELAEALIEQKLAACVQIDPVTSYFVWNDSLSREKEFRLSIKARSADFPPLSAAIRALHSYQTPEIIALPILDGDAKFLEWARRATNKNET